MRGKRKKTEKLFRRKHKATALIISMIFVVIFSALAVSMAAISSTNLQIADNQHKANSARASAESGFDIIRFWLNRVSLSNSAGSLLTKITTALQADWANNQISNITATCDGSTITFPAITLNSAQGQTFSAQITQPDANTIQVSIIGTAETITRTIQANYGLEPGASEAFEYGIASKGPLSLAGNIELQGVNIAVEASVYIESENSTLALSIIGNSQIAGNVGIVNPLATVYLQGGQASIGGETGQDAIDNHVTTGMPPTEFPEPNTAYFSSYITNTIDANTDTTADATFENVRILANTNPTFSGNVTLNGIIFIEQPNIVTFTGSADITGIIVGNGDITDDSGVNQIDFQGNVTSSPVSDLPDEPQFAEIRNDTGTFLMAPGFAVSFGGNFNTLNGAIAANGFELYGNAGGTIDGSIINYSQEQMILTGNSDLYFNRSGTTELPPGFIPNIILQYDPGSYSENIL